MKGFEKLWDLLFPPKCPFCGQVTEQMGICDACRKELPWTEGEDALRKLGSLRCCAPLWYEDRAREGILNLKFHGRSAAAEPMGDLIAQCAAEWFTGEFELVTWVPVGRRRLRERGYDQAELLARGACRIWQTEPVHLLRKTVENPSQSGLKEAAARRANVLGVYEPVDPEKIQGKRILLIDDVCTTGATLCECARVLEDARAKSVVCAVVARTRPHREASDFREQGGTSGKKFK